jgi:ABC-type amino acid transport substrate-binding protein
MRGLIKVICLLALITIAAAQHNGNDQLRQAINAALSTWIADGTAASRWAYWYGTELPYNQDQLGGCSSTFPAKDQVIAGGTLDAVIQRGELLIGSDFPSPPLYFYQGASTTVVGFDQDFANYLTTQLSVQYGKTITSRRVNTVFGDLLPSLNNNNFDVASGGMFATAARKQIANFACNISLGALGGIVIDPTTYPNIDAINKPGVIVGALSNTTQFTIATSSGATVVPVTNADAALPLLLNGTINAWLGSSSTIAYWIQSQTGVSQIPQWGPTDGVAWAVRKETSSAVAVSASFLVVFAVLVSLF